VDVKVEGNNEIVEKAEPMVALILEANLAIIQTHLTFLCPSSSSSSTHTHAQVKKHNTCFSSNTTSKL